MAQKCWKCGGSGVLPQFRHISMGRCFACEGSGKAPPRRKRTFSSAPPKDTTVWQYHPFHALKRDWLLAVHPKGDHFALLDPNLFQPGGEESPDERPIMRLGIGSSGFYDKYPHGGERQATLTHVLTKMYPAFSPEQMQDGLDYPGDYARTWKRIHQRWRAFKGAMVKEINRSPDLMELKLLALAQDNPRTFLKWKYNDREEAWETTHRGERWAVVRRNLHRHPQYGLCRWPQPRRSEWVASTSVPPATTKSARKRRNIRLLKWAESYILDDLEILAKALKNPRRARKNGWREQVTRAFDEGEQRKLDQVIKRRWREMQQRLGVPQGSINLTYKVDDNYDHFKKKRGYAVCFYDGGNSCQLQFSTKMLTAPKHRQDAIVRHELGHVVDFIIPKKVLDAKARRLGVKLPHTPERRADALALAVWKEPIRYDRDLVQSTRTGSTTRPRHLGL